LYAHRLFLQPLTDFQPMSLRCSPGDLLPEDNSSAPEQEENKPETRLRLKLVGENSGEKPSDRLDIQSRRRASKADRRAPPIESNNHLAVAKGAYQTEAGTAKKKEAVGDQRRICLHSLGECLLEPVSHIPCRWKMDMCIIESRCSRFVSHVCRLSCEGLCVPP
jgi:hypothetical protein